MTSPGQSIALPPFLHPYHLLRIAKKIISIILSALVYPLGYAFLGFVIGTIIEVVPILNVAVNNGFYYIGIDAGFRLGEACAGIGFLFGMLGVFVKPILPEIKIVIPASVPPPHESTSKRPLEQIAQLLSTVTPEIEAELTNAGIHNLLHLATSEVSDISNIVGGKMLASEIVEEARVKVRELN